MNTQVRYVIKGEPVVLPALKYGYSFQEAPENGYLVATTTSVVFVPESQIKAVTPRKRVHRATTTKQSGMIRMEGDRIPRSYNSTRKDSQAGVDGMGTQPDLSGSA